MGIMVINPTGTQLMIAFFVIILIGILISFFLFMGANRKERVAAPLLRTPKEGEDLSISVLHELDKLRLSSPERIHATKAIIQLVDHEIQKKTEGVKKDYEKILNEKNEALKQTDKTYREVNLKYETLNKNFSQLGVQKKQTEAMIHSMAEGLVVVNDKGEVLLMNPAAERLLDVKKEEKIGKPIMGDISEQHLISLVKNISGSEEKEILINSQSENTKKILRASNAVIEDESGHTIGMVSILSDVTKEKELEELKSEFVAKISHELRTPLNSVQETIALLLDKVVGNINSDQERILSIGKRQIQRLSRLINDLLDLSKMEAQKLRLDRKPFQLEEWLRQTVAGFEVWANNKKIKLETRCPSEPLEIEADQDRLTQVVTNLIGNSMKFTPAGGKITIEAKKIQDREPVYLNVSVRDTGLGIPKQEQPKIFDKFVQLSSSMTSTSGGAGLGLTISKEIVELHGGRIWVESEEGKGSCFIFEIPVKNGTSNSDVETESNNAK